MEGTSNGGYSWMLNQWFVVAVGIDSLTIGLVGLMQTADSSGDGSKDGGAKTEGAISHIGVISTRVLLAQYQYSTSTRWHMAPRKDKESTQQSPPTPFEL